MLERDYARGLSERLADLAREMRELDDFRYRPCPCRNWRCG